MIIRSSTRPTWRPLPNRLQPLLHVLLPEMLLNVPRDHFVIGVVVLNYHVAVIIHHANKFLGFDIVFCARQSTFDIPRSIIGIMCHNIHRGEKITHTLRMLFSSPRGLLVGDRIGINVHNMLLCSWQCFIYSSDVYCLWSPTIRSDKICRKPRIRITQTNPIGKLVVGGRNMPISSYRLWRNSNISILR